MENEDKNEWDNIGDKIKDKLEKAYKQGKSYEMKVNDGGYWRKVNRFTKIKEIIEGER